jgi:hypothetical protein
MSVDDVKRSGRATQGVIVMRLREGERVSTLAPVVGSDEDGTVVDGTVVDGTVVDGMVGLEQVPAGPEPPEPESPEPEPAT